MPVRVPATDTDLEQALLDPAVVDELHAFLWTEPYLHRGTPDDGWSARDHVVVVGALLRALGAEVRIRHGRCMFVQGPGPGGSLPVGIGQEGSARVGHAWLLVPGLGDVDLSPRLASPQPPWTGVDSPGIVGSAWIAPREASFATTPKLVDYMSAIERATRATDELRAVYHVQREEPYGDDVAATGLSWASSRVSQRLLARGLPEDLYRRLAAHLLGLRAGHRQPLRGISPNKAWAILAADRELAGPR